MAERTPCQICGEKQNIGIGDKLCVECWSKADKREKLRDQMAAAALTGILASPEPGDDWLEPGPAARRVYTYADALLAEREKRSEPEREQWMIDGHHPAIEDIQVAMGQGRKPRLEPDGTVTVERERGGGHRVTPATASHEEVSMRGFVLPDGRRLTGAVVKEDDKHYWLDIGKGVVKWSKKGDNAAARKVVEDIEGGKD